MDANKRREISLKAVKTFGINHQIDKLIEELGELLQATIKLRQATKDGVIKLTDNNNLFFTNFIEELADVDVLKDQIVLAFALDDEANSLLQEFKDMKLERLEKRMSQKSITDFFENSD